jgi:PAS domain S-box-containing protein
MTSPVVSVKRHLCIEVAAGTFWPPALRSDDPVSQTVDQGTAPLADWPSGLLETVLASLRDGIVVRDAQGTLLYANEQGARLGDLAEGVEVARADGAPLDPEELPDRRARRGEEPGPMLVRVRANEGEADRVVRVSAVPVRDEACTVRHVVCVYRDVTLEHRVGVRQAFAAGAGVALAGALDYRAALETVAALAVPAFADWCAIDLIEDGEPVRVATAGTAVEDTRDELAFSLPIGAYGEISFAASARAHPYDDYDLVLARDLATRAAAAIEGALLTHEAQQTSALLDTLFASAPVGLGFWDSELRYVRVNQALAAMNGRPVEEHLGNRVGDVIPELAPRIEEICRTVLDTGAPVHRVEVRGADRTYVASYYPVAGPDGTRLGIGAIVEDVTESRRDEQRVELHHTVTRLLADAESVEAAIAAVLEAIGETLDWDVGCYWPAVDPDRARTIWVREGFNAEGFVATTKRLDLAPETLPGRVAASQRAAWIDDLASASLPRASIAAAEGLTSGVAFPILTDAGVSGVVDLFARERHARDEAAEALLRALGSQLGQFVERKRGEDERLQLLLREQAARAEAEAAATTLRRLERITDVVLTHLELGDLLTALLERIVEVLEADCGAILLLTENDELEHRAAFGLDPAAEVAVPVGRGIVGTVAATRRQLLVPDLSQVDVFSPALKEMNSAVAIPLVVEDELVGVLFAGSRAYAQFVDEDARLLELMTDRVAFAVHQAALRDAEREAQERLRFLGEASALLGSTLDVERTLEQLGSLLVGHIADWCAIHLVDEAGSVRLVTVAARDPVKQEQARSEEPLFRPGRPAPSTVREVIRTRAGAIFTHAETVEGSLEAAEGIHTGIVVPLVARERAVGAISIVRAENPEKYTDADLRFALDLARRAAVAIDNAQLFRAAEERAQAARVLASVGDGVFFIDRAEVVRTWNAAAERSTGLRARQVVDRPAAEAIPGWQAVAARIPVSAGGAAARAESLPLEVNGRELWLSIHGVSVPDGIVYAFRDLTEERAVERMRAEFVSTVSHELRTPLAAIYGAAMTLRRTDVALDDDQRARLLEVVSGEADRLARTVNDILWASRLDTDTLHVNIQGCDPLALAREVITAQGAHLGGRHELVLDAEPGLPSVAGDPDKVGRILINLVDNAVKYSPDGGPVVVRVAQAGSRVRFSVADRGLGIPPAEQRRIFEKFYRLDPDMTRGVGGTGLGLYICRELVQRMEGRLWVESPGLGYGSTFSFELPAGS